MSCLETAHDVSRYYGLTRPIFNPRKKHVLIHGMFSESSGLQLWKRHLLSTPSLCVQSTQDIYDAQIICSASLTSPRCVRVNVNVQSCFSHVPCICCRFLYIWQPYWRNFYSQEKSSQIVESPLRSIQDFPVKEKLPRHKVMLPRNSYPCSLLGHPFPEILDDSGAHQSMLMFGKPCFCTWFQILCRVGTQIPHFSFFAWIYFKKRTVLERSVWWTSFCPLPQMWMSWNSLGLNINTSWTHGLEMPNCVQNPSRSAYTIP